MRHKGTDTSAGTKTQNAAAPDFYLQPFASQMIVWAVRRHLLGRTFGTNGMADVAHVFGMAGWRDLLDSLVLVVDAMAVTTKLVVHQVSCPALVRHETALLNALAHLQTDNSESARAALRDLLPVADAREALRHLYSIASLIRSQGLRIDCVRPIAEPAWMSPFEYRKLHHVH